MIECETRWGKDALIGLSQNEKTSCLPLPRGWFRTNTISKYIIPFGRKVVVLTFLFELPSMADPFSTCLNDFRFVAGNTLEHESRGTTKNRHLLFRRPRESSSSYGCYFNVTSCQLPYK